MAQTSNKHKGFTLLEVLFALVIISVVMFSYSKSLSVASSHSLLANQKFFARVLLKNAYAQDRIERRVLNKTTEIEFAGALWLLEREEIESSDSKLMFIRYQAFRQDAANKKAISILFGRGDKQ